MIMAQGYSSEALQLIDGSDGWKREEMDTL